MRKTLSLWLTGIIVLTVVAFLAVFQPITFWARKDPAERTMWLRPVGASASFDRESKVAPDPTVSLKVGGLKLYLYKPMHDLNLDMDLRGGMRVVLQAANQAEFRYAFKKEARLTTSTEANRKAEALSTAVKTALGESVAAGTKVFVTQESVTIITLAERSDVAEQQLAIIDPIVRSTFNANGFATVPDKENNATYFRPADEATMGTVREIIDARINHNGLSEATTFVEGSNQLVVQIPGVQRPEQVQRILGTTAEMELMLLDESITPGRELDGKATLSRGGLEISSEEALRSAMLVVRGSDLDPKAIGTGVGPEGPQIDFGLKSEAAKQFENITGANIGRHLAIVLDGEVVSAPVIKGAIGTHGQISGNFTEKSAKELASLLKAGALPVPLTEVASSQVSASLGADSVQWSMWAGLIGLAAVLVFMLLYYRLPGLIASFALIIYVFLSLAVLRMFDATLSLPGIAGIIISIGMAVDANVIIFERLKEELRAGKPIETAIDVAFKRAWTAILDSNVASLITGAVLWSLGTGAVKGFAVTLVIGVAVSMFTAVTVTRLFMKLMAHSKLGHNMALYGVK